MSARSHRVPAIENAAHEELLYGLLKELAAHLSQALAADGIGHGFIGGTALKVGYGLTRPTTDLDVLDTLACARFKIVRDGRGSFRVSPRLHHAHRPGIRANRWLVAPRTDRGRMEPGRGGNHRPHNCIADLGDVPESRAQVRTLGTFGSTSSRARSMSPSTGFCRVLHRQPRIDMPQSTSASKSSNQLERTLRLALGPSIDSSAGCACACPTTPDRLRTVGVSTSALVLTRFIKELDGGSSAGPRSD